MSEVAVEKSATQSKCEANQNSSNEDWKDFTNQFREYCGFLPLGELVHDESFTLREAMSAVELLDSKMDETIAIRDFYLKHCTCGTDTLSSHSTLDPKLLESKLSLNDQGSSKSKCHCLSSRRPIDVDLAFELGAVLTNGFTDSERIAVMDELLACVFAWLDGQGTIAHTLFASYYLNRPHILRRDKEPLLRAFVEFVLKLADHSRGIICSASVYEEEDFQSAIFNFSTTVRLDDGTEAELSNARFSSILKELDEDLSRRVKALSRKLKPSADQQTSKPNGLVAGAESPLSDSDATRSHSKSTSSSDSSSPRAELDLLNALHCRLKFARYLFLFFHHFRSACLIPSESHSRELEEARRHLRAAIAALREVDASISLGVQHDRPEGVYTDPELLKLGFDSFLHHHISSGGIPRFARIPTRKAALKWFAECLDSLLAAFDVRRSETFEQLLNFLDWHRMKQRNSALTRSALFLLVYPHQEGGSGSGVEKKLKLFGERSAAETAHESVRRFLLFAPWSCSDPRMQALFDVERGRLPMRAHLDVFLQRVALVLHESVVTRCVNPSRQRERTPFLLENELSVFYSETAEVLDDTFTHAVLALDATHPLRVALNPIFERTKEQSGQLQRLHCFDLYPLHHIVVEMVDYTLDGLRSQLFASYEFRYVFWYLGEMLYGWLNHLHQLRSEQLEMVTRLEQEWEKSNRSSKSKAKGRTRREKRRDDAAQPFRSERDEFDYSALVVNAYRHLALGIFKLILGFELLNWLRVPDFEFTSEEIRYRHRFQPFLNLAFLPPQNYETFRGNCQDQCKRLQEQGRAAMPVDVARTLSSLPPDEREKLLSERTAAAAFSEAAMHLESSRGDLESLLAFQQAQSPQSKEKDGSANGSGSADADDAGDDMKAFRAGALFDVSGSLQACKTNLVTAKLLANATGTRFHLEPADATGRPSRVNFEFGPHAIFPFVKLSLNAT